MSWDLANADARPTIEPMGGRPQQSAGLAITVHDHLECGEQARYALDLVENGAGRKIGDDPNRVSFSGSADHVHRRGGWS